MRRSGRWSWPWTSSSRKGSELSRHDSPLPAAPGEGIYDRRDIAQQDAGPQPRSMTVIELPKPWRLVDDRHRKYIGGELSWELTLFPDHPLVNRSFQVVAMKDPYNNAIIQFDDDDSFGYVRLTWGAAWPHFEPIGGEAQLFHFMRGGAAAVVAILEDDPDRTAAMKQALERELPAAEAIFFDNAPDMIEWLGANLGKVCVLSLDHDLGPNRKREGEIFDPGVGRDVVTFLETMPCSCPVIVHSSNSRAGDGMLYALERDGWPAERIYPFQDLAWVDSHWVGRITACVPGDRSITPRYYFVALSTNPS